MNDAPPCLSVAGAAGAPASRLRVAVVPNARRTGADGLHDGALRVRLNAPPVDGKANDTLVAWLADELDLPKRAVRLMHGQTGRRKTIELDAAPEAVAAWLARVLGA